MRELRPQRDAVGPGVRLYVFEVRGSAEAEVARFGVEKAIAQ
jgi:hypothetical protein